MAIFYEHIKGCGLNSTGATNSKTDLGAGLKGASIRDNTQINQNSTVDLLPSFHYNTTNQYKSENDLGRIIVSNATGQSIDKPFTFKEAINCNNDVYLNKHTLGLCDFTDNQKIYKTTFIYNDSKYTSQGCNQPGDTNNITTITQNIDGITIETADIEQSIELTSAAIKISGYTTISKYLNIGSAKQKTQDGDLSAKNIYSDLLCQAQYFNATSDRRAKSNIRTAEFSALDIIDTAEVKNFTYKDSQTPSIGLIAQDLINEDIDDFSLVANKTASGEKGDYMSIHESKLIYVLWKAIQEQQEEIELLGSELNALRKQLNK